MSALCRLRAPLRSEDQQQQPGDRESGEGTAHEERPLEPCRIP